MPTCLARSKDYILHKKVDSLPACALLCPVIKTLLLQEVAASLTKVSIIHALVFSKFCLVLFFLRSRELSTLFGTNTNDVVTGNIQGRA
jgi:hypothetical protein